MPGRRGTQKCSSWKTCSRCGERPGASVPRASARPCLCTKTHRAARPVFKTVTSFAKLDSEHRMVRLTEAFSMPTFSAQRCGTFDTAKQDARCLVVAAEEEIFSELGKKARGVHHQSMPDCLPSGDSLQIALDRKSVV